MLRHLAKLSIRAKILGTFIILVAAILLLLNQLLAPRSEDTIANIADLGHVTARLLADKEGPAIDFGDTQSMTEDIRETATLHEISYIAALGHDGELLAESGDRPAELLEMGITKLAEGTEWRSGGLLVVAHKVFNQSDKPIGRIIVAMGLQDVLDEQDRHTQAIGLGAIIAGVMGILVAFILTRFVLRPIEVMRRGVQRVAQGDLETHDVVVSSKDAIGELGTAINQMTHSLRQVSDENERERWLRTGQAELDEAMRGDLNVGTLAQRIINTIAQHLGAQAGAFYLPDDDQILRLAASFALSQRVESPVAHETGDGLIGQAAQDRRTHIITDIPDGYLKIGSGLGSAPPASIIVTPVTMEETVVGVIELASLKSMGDQELAFLQQVGKGVAIAISSAINREQVQVLLAKTQQQSQALLKQQAQLTQANQDLQAQTDILERAKREIEQQSLAIQQASKYKSEFLANMSHELRSPLNAMLILTKTFTENESGNLTAEQCQTAEIIHRGGTDLLTLINDILDLSKVEAGRLEVNFEPTELTPMIDELEGLFAPVAREKDLAIDFSVAADVPEVVVTDRFRLMQILKNLLSNAFKFTERGKVSLHVRSAGSKRVAFSVADTGIGIPVEKKEQIFQAFIQADGSTSRTYGGTGLGLAISQELTDLLGGTIGLQSDLGQGCEFTLTLSVAQPASATTAGRPANDPAEVCTEPAEVEFLPLAAPAQTPEPGSGLLAGHRVLLVDTDLRSAFALSKVLRDAGMQVTLAENGDDDALARLEGAPDIKLVLVGVAGPGAGGLETIERIRSHPGHAQVPIIAMAAETIDRKRCLAAGASDVIPKPVDPADLLALLRRRVDGRTVAPAPVAPGSAIADSAS